MGTLLKYSDFISLNEGSATAIAGKQLELYFAAVKKLRHAKVTSPFKYQPFDKEFYFEFSLNTAEYRVFYDDTRDGIFMLDNKTGDEMPINNLRDFTNLIIQ